MMLTKEDLIEQIKFEIRFKCLLEEDVKKGIINLLGSYKMPEECTREELEKVKRALFSVQPKEETSETYLGDFIPFAHYTYNEEVEEPEIDHSCPYKQRDSFGNWWLVVDNTGELLKAFPCDKEGHPKENAKAIWLHPTMV